VADLFTRLAERAQGQASVVDPRQPARFEPAGPEPSPSTASNVDSPMHVTVVVPAGPIPPSPFGEPAPDRGASGETIAGEAPRSPREVKVTTPIVRSRPEPNLSPPSKSRATREEPAELRPRAEVSNVEHRPERIRPVVAAFTPPPARRSEAARPQRQPAVHISIGRIEVRAIPAAPAPAPPETRAPQAKREETGLSLGTYLRGDDGRPK
jgi:hypothetical protein